MNYYALLFFDLRQNALLVPLALLQPDFLLHVAGPNLRQGDDFIRAL
jgi:hypothetical protein